MNKDFLKILTKLGVEPIEAEGQEFDPNFHQAIQQAESTEYPENTVSKCARPPRFFCPRGQVVPASPGLCVCSPAVRALSQFPGCACVVANNGTGDRCAS